jgi:hypothetical protein
MKALELKHTIVKPLFRTYLSPILSPKTVQWIRFRWWCLSSYIPRLISSGFVKRTPYVRSFGSSLIPSHLASQLEKVNTLAPTKMCRVMSKYGSDKGRVHNYTTVYSALFKERGDQPLRILELGMGTNNPDVLSNMGMFGAPGASLFGWRELFPKSLVYGADIDRRILFQKDRIKTFYCNQLDQTSIRGLWSHPELQGGADVIIEDGLHTLEANISFLEGSLQHLRPGGTYITEDIASSDVDKWYDLLETTLSKKYPNYEFVFVVFEGGKRDAYHVLVVRRGAE